MDITRDDVLAAIARERAWQDAKWGTVWEHGHEPASWLTIARRELREAEDAWCSKRGDEGALEELLQVASVLVACLTQYHYNPLVGIIFTPRRTYAVGSWITVLDQRLRVATNFCVVKSDVQATFEEMARLIDEVIQCIQQHGIVERPEIQ